MVRMTHFDMELTQRQAAEYKKATKKDRGDIITRYCKLTTISRNLASKRFRKVLRDIHPRVLNTKRIPGKKRGRKPIFISFHKGIIKQAWELSGEICAERLHPVMGVYINQLTAGGKLKYYGKRYIAETRTMSERTLKRIIADFPKTGGNNKRKGNAAIYKQIPIQAYFGKHADTPGYIEIDYVEHNGGNAAGLYACTVTYTDVALGWITRSAALGKSMSAVETIHTHNETRIYHQVFEYHPDNAKPVLKLLFEKTQGEKPMNYSISRSRPYHKEDNGHVEQKNGDKVRKLVGYHRYDNQEQVELLNRLYALEDIISNFFLPSQKLTGKVKDEKGRVIRKKYDTAQTAYQRLLKAEDIHKEVKTKVRKIYNGLNLVEMRKEADTLQQQLLQTVILRK